MTTIKEVTQFVKETERLQLQVVLRVEEEDEEMGDGETEVEEQGDKQQYFNL